MMKPFLHFCILALLMTGAGTSPYFSALGKVPTPRPIPPNTPAAGVIARNSIQVPANEYNKLGLLSLTLLLHPDEGYGLNIEPGCVMYRLQLLNVNEKKDLYEFEMLNDGWFDVTGARKSAKSQILTLRLDKDGKASFETRVPDKEIGKPK